MVEAYSHEVSSCGFWPGGGLINEPAFMPILIQSLRVLRNTRSSRPEAFYHRGISEFLLPYDVVRSAKSPDEVLLSFLQWTYEAEATCAKWDRAGLERQ